MRTSRLRLIAAALALGLLLLVLGMVLAPPAAKAQIPDAQRPPLVTDYANYPNTPQAFLTPGCDFSGLLFPTFGARLAATGSGVEFGPYGDLASLPPLGEGDLVRMAWTDVAPACVGSAVSFVVKVAPGGSFDPTVDQLTGPNGGYSVDFLAAGPGELTFPMPDLARFGLGCNFQLDAIVGIPLRDVGPSGSFFTGSLRTQAGKGNGDDRTTVISFRNGTYGSCEVPSSTTTPTTPTTSPTTAPPGTVGTTTTLPPTTVPPTTAPPSTTPFSVPTTVPGSTSSTTPGSTSSTAPGTTVPTTTVPLPETFSFQGAATVCRAEVPTILIEFGNALPTLAGQTGTLTMSDVNGNVVSTQPLVYRPGTSVELLYPGTRVNADGSVADVPGWVLNSSGLWVRDPTDEFLRAGINLTYQLNPTATAFITYPPETAACANPDNPTPSATTSPAPIVRQPSTPSQPSTPGQPSTPATPSTPRPPLVNTGANDSTPGWVLVGVALIALGAAMVRRWRAAA